MGSTLRSGFYLGRKSCALLGALLGALVVALLALGSLYGRCARRLEEERPPAGTPAAPALASPAPTAGRPPGPWDEPRLPGDVAPLHYSLLLWPLAAPGLAEAPHAHWGQANITLRCLRATSRLLLHSHLLSYRGASVWGPLDAPDSVPVAELWLAPLRQYAVLELRANLSAGALYQLRLSFQGQISGEPEIKGLFFSSYEDEGESRWLIASQLEPVAARNVYPCFDEPAMKATFNISIVHHPSYVALSNMPALGASEYKDLNESTFRSLSNWTGPMNWTVTTFETTPKMSTYITVFIVCNFDYVTTTERGNQIRIWAKKDAIRNGFADYALNITGPLFSFMEDFLNISYPLSKTDLIALPELGPSGMENWGLMTFTESSLLYRPQDKFSYRKMVICQIISHEIGHQWFGNLVTMNWWNDLWLNEGFASYLEYLGADYIKCGVEMDKVFSSSVLLPMLEMDDMPSRSLSVADEKQHTDILTHLFDPVTYQKGASIVRMLCSFMTEGLFIKALNSYLNAISFSNAIQDDLWYHFQKVIDEQNGLQLPAPVKVIMDTWTCQFGFPVLTVDLSTGSIKQEQFNNSIENRTQTHNNTWIIPISWMRNGITQRLVWLDNSNKIFPEMKILDSEHDWIILNVNVTGYYRINYDQLHWRRLAKVLERDPKVIPAANRLQLMSDAFVLERFGYIEYDIPLYLTKYLEKEDDSVVWNMVLLHLHSNNWKLIWSDHEFYPVLKKYFLPRISSVYHHYASLLRQSFEVLEVDYFARDGIEKILKLACEFGLRDCFDLSSEIFTKWMDNPNHETPFCVSRTICCYGIKMGNEKEWHFAWKMYRDNNTREEKYAIIFALSCTHEPQLLQRLLHYTLNESIIPSQFVPSVIGAVAATEVGYWLAWRFVTDNWSSLNNRHKTVALNTLVDHVETDLQVQMVQLFLNNTLDAEQRILINDEMMAAKTDKDEEKEQIIRMIKWLQKNLYD
ncbi:aminopeptidase Q [Tiliqua scincoides]|uniref:aminopeptidase Q n=1 Tax=Tiliqua scincoides TaxID=71010 RepID=UPI0034627DAF